MSAGETRSAHGVVGRFASHMPSPARGRITRTAGAHPAGALAFGACSAAPAHGTVALVPPPDTSGPGGGGGRA